MFELPTVTESCKSIPALIEQARRILNDLERANISPKRPPPAFTKAWNRLNEVVAAIGVDWEGRRDQEVANYLECGMAELGAIAARQMNLGRHGR
jgi:hypothetical protein